MWWENWKKVKNFEIKQKLWKPLLNDNRYKPSFYIIRLLWIKIMRGHLLYVLETKYYCCRPY